MIGNYPAIREVHRALDLFLEQAYQGIEPPLEISNVISRLKSATDFDYLQLPIWETDGAPTPTRLAVRLGNRFYPHMKLLLQRRPDQLGYAFRIETHDECLLTSRVESEWEQVAHLMQQNREIASAIEKSWERNGLTTMNQSAIRLCNPC